MPLIKTKKTEKYRYAIWKIEENSETLLKLLKPNKYELTLLNKIINQKRKDQSISAKILLNNILQKKTTIFYNGKVPYCKEFSNISITHSDNYAAVLLSEKKIGIDLQKEEQKISINHTDLKKLREFLELYHASRRLGLSSSELISHMISYESGLRV